MPGTDYKPYPKENTNPNPFFFFLLASFPCLCTPSPCTPSYLPNPLGERSLKSPIQADLDAFHSGFQTCAKEVLQFLSRFESWTPREPRCVQLMSHLHAVAAQFWPAAAPLLQPPGPGTPAAAAPAAPNGPGSERAAPKLEPPAHCVPVIQRTQPSTELATAAEHDTDTDSGYGGEAEARPAGAPRVTIKQEPPGDDPPAPKRLKLDPRGGSGGGPPTSALLGPEPGAAAALLRPDAALLSSLVAWGGGGGTPFAPPAAPFCLPFYFLSPSAAAAYVQPFLDKSGLEKYLYPAAAAPFPLLYPGLAAAAAAAAAFPCLSSVLSPPPEKPAPDGVTPAGRRHLPCAGPPEALAQAEPPPPPRDSP